MSAPNPSPADEWTILKTEILARIEVIDKATPWQEVEPRWWLEMMRVRALLSQS